MAELSVTVDTPDGETEERFVRKDVAPAVKRLGDAYEIIFYGRYSTSTSVDGGRVKVVFKGDSDEVQAEERDRWDSLSVIGWPGSESNTTFNA